MIPFVQNRGHIDLELGLVSQHGQSISQPWHAEIDHHQSRRDCRIDLQMLEEIPQGLEERLRGAEEKEVVGTSMHIEDSF